MGITVFAIPSYTQDEAARERAVMRLGLLDRIGDPAVQELAERARREFRTAMSAVTILYHDWQYVIAASGMDTGVYSRRTSFCGHAVLSNESFFCIPDARQDVRFSDNPNVEDGVLRFYAGARIEADGVPLGMVCVFDPEPRMPLGCPQQSQLRDLGSAVERAIGAGNA